MTITLDPSDPLLAPADDATRREFVVGSVSLAALLAAGCGADGDRRADETVRAFVDDRDVTVQVPAQAERIVDLTPEPGPSVTSKENR